MFHVRHIKWPVWGFLFSCMCLNVAGRSYWYVHSLAAFLGDLVIQYNSSAMNSAFTMFSFMKEDQSSCKKKKERKRKWFWLLLFTILTFFYDFISECKVRTLCRFDWHRQRSVNSTTCLITNHTLLSECMHKHVFCLLLPRCAEFGDRKLVSLSSASGESVSLLTLTVNRTRVADSWE